jgi:hypothetical protein
MVRRQRRTHLCDKLRLLPKRIVMESLALNPLAEFWNPVRGVLY